MKKESECKLCKCAQNAVGQTLLLWWGILMVEKGICGPEKKDFDISLFHTHSVSVDIKML